MTDPSVDNGRRTGRETGNEGKFDVAWAIAGACSVPSSLRGCSERPLRAISEYTADHLP
jgi:hypothetical protein